MEKEDEKVQVEEMDPAKKEDVEDEDDAKSDADTVSEESDDDDDMFEGLSADQIRLIMERQEALKKKFQAHAEKEMTAKIKDLVSATGITKDEARVAIECCNNDEMEAASRITMEPDFMIVIRESLAEEEWERTYGSQQQNQNGEKVKIKISDGNPNKRAANAPPRPQRSTSSAKKPPQGFKMDGEARAINLRLGDALKKLEEIQKKKEIAMIQERQREANSEVPATEGEKIVEITSDTESTEEKEAVKVEWTEEDLKALKWSDARIKAFLNRESNPNAYYYRFNAPGEEQETGEWSIANKKLFMELIKDGVDYRWGIFSMKIPGRVGYQCSNYYRKLIQSGVVEDPNYFIDQGGKLSFKRPVGLKRGTAQAMKINGEAIEMKRPVAAPKPAEPKKTKPKPKKRRTGDDYVYADEIDSGHDSDTGTYGYGGGVSNKKRKMAPKVEEVVHGDQLIPGLKCPMTFEPIYDPAISPYGHVMGYNTWLRVLGREPKNTCPFTKQKLSRRDLIKLDKHNIEEYRDIIQEAETTA